LTQKADQGKHDVVSRALVPEALEATSFLELA
jgi:hypothetical protein